MSSVCQRRRFRDWLREWLWEVEPRTFNSLKLPSQPETNKQAHSLRLKLTAFLENPSFESPLLHPSHFKQAAGLCPSTFKDICSYRDFSVPYTGSRIIHLMGASFALISPLTGARQVSCLFLYNHFSVWSWHMLDNKERFIVWIRGRTSLIKAHSHHLCSYTPLCAEASLCAVQKACSFICPQEAHVASHPGGEGARCCIVGGPVCTRVGLPQWLRW